VRTFKTSFGQAFEIVYFGAASCLEDVRANTADTIFPILRMGSAFIIPVCAQSIE